MSKPADAQAPWPPLPRGKEAVRTSRTAPFPRPGCARGWHPAFQHLVRVHPWPQFSSLPTRGKHSFRKRVDCRGSISECSMLDFYEGEP